MLCWASKREAEVLVKHAGVNVDHEPNEGAGRRYAIGTKHYWELVVAQQKFLPD
jgi:hypothetical protein